MFVFSVVNNKIKEKYGFMVYEYLFFFKEFVSDSIYKKKWKFMLFFEKENKLIFKIGDWMFMYNDFVKNFLDR